MIRCQSRRFLPKATSSVTPRGISLLHYSARSDSIAVAMFSRSTKNIKNIRSTVPGAGLLTTRFFTVESKCCTTAIALVKKNFFSTTNIVQPRNDASANAAISVVAVRLPDALLTPKSNGAAATPN